MQFAGQLPNCCQEATKSPSSQSDLLKNLPAREHLPIVVKLASATYPFHCLSSKSRSPLSTGPQDRHTATFVFLPSLYHPLFALQTTGEMCRLPVPNTPLLQPPSIFKTCMTTLVSKAWRNDLPMVLTPVLCR